MKHRLSRAVDHISKTPLWKQIVIIFIVIAMPLFFALARNINTQQAISTDNELSQQNTAPSNP